MQLYYAPGACSLADHIALIEGNIPHTLVRVGRDRQTEDGRDFLSINPKGYTPALQLDDGTILTENLAILAYIADRSGKLLAKSGLDRWRTLELTTQITTEIHPSFKPFFWDAPQEQKDAARSHLDKHFGFIAEQMAGGRYLVGEEISIADAFLTVMLMWANMFGIAVPASLSTYLTQMKSEPSVVEALRQEGLV